MRIQIVALFTAVLLSLVLQTRSAYSQNRQAIILGGTDLSLGTKKSDVLKSLAEVGSQLDSIVNGNDTWLVLQKNPVSGEMESIGHVQFIAGKLASVEKEWGQAEGQDAIQLLTSLYSAIRGLTSEDGSVAVIRTYENDEPGISIKSIDIQIQGRSFTVGIANDAKLQQQQVYVQEQIPQY